MTPPQLSAERLHEVLDYDPVSGEFHWRLDRPRFPAGTRAGYNCGKYRRLWVDGRSYAAHRLAWFYTYGEWPSRDLDHINENKLDNRICNLRPATNAENQQNRSTSYVSNKTGLLGVSALGNKFRAQITANGVKHYLGLFDTPEDASAAYVAAKSSLHSFWSPS